MALKFVDWPAMRRRAEIGAFNDQVADTAAVVERLRRFDVVCVMRERTSLTKDIPRKLPRLKLIASTGPRNSPIDTQTANDLGIAVSATGYDSTSTIEFAWSLILASMRHLDRKQHPCATADDRPAQSHDASASTSIVHRRRRAVRFAPFNRARPSIVWC